MLQEQIQQFFQEYQNILLKVEQLETTLRTQHDWQTWCTALQERAQYFHQTYLNMSQQIKGVRQLLEHDTALLDEGCWEALRVGMMGCYHADTHDLALLLELANILELHYADSPDLTVTTDVRSCLSYTNLEFSRILRQPFGQRAVTCYRQIAALWKDYGRIPHHSVHLAIVVSFANLVTSCLVLRLVSLEEAFTFWEEMKQLQASDDFRATRESEPDVANLLDTFVARFETDAYGMACTNEQACNPPHPVFPALMQRAMEMTRKHYESISVPEVRTAEHFQIIISQCAFQYQTGEKTADACWKELHDFYMQTCDEVQSYAAVEVWDFDVISYRLTMLATLIAYLAETSMTRSEKQVYFRQYQQDIRDFITDYDTRTGHCHTLSNALEELAFLPAAYELFDTSEEKIDYIFRMVIVRHCTTFLHSLMVSVFADAILSHVIDEKPELLLGYHGLQSVAEVQAHRTELLQFARSAALLHDVGKNAMLTIIETQHRPLTDMEFSIIRAHPSRGSEFLSIDPDLARYQDITRGHHKFYNGQGGYPANFDNTQSPERFMIDVIRLCDCLDAATDHYGRNYQQAKTSDEVLEEFRLGAGTRYNPDLTAFLLSNPALRQRLRSIAGEERLQIYYQTYQKYFQ